MTTIIITSFPTPNRAPAGKFVQISSQHVPLRAQHQRGAPQQGRTGQAEGFDVALPVEGMVSTCLCIYILLYIIYYYILYITIYYILLYIIYYYILYITIYNILLLLYNIYIYIQKIHVIYAYTYHLVLHQIDKQEQNTVLT